MPSTVSSDAASSRWRGCARKLAAPVLACVVLAALNAWIFGDLYAGRALFPWDFQQSYHAIPFYWQAVVSTGRFPEWIPYQAIGYPLQLPMQSGLLYPPLWLFPIFRMVYSLRAAASFQCLHVLAAALGVLWLARVRGFSWLAAILAGCGSAPPCTSPGAGALPRTGGRGQRGSAYPPQASAEAMTSSAWASPRSGWQGNDSTRAHRSRARVSLRPALHSATLAR
jgi:hypothetical protein